jgi:hypothetical protein
MAARNNSSRVPLGRKIDPLLPYSIISEKTKKPRLRLRSLFGHCHYRRVFTWLIGIAFLVTLIFVKSRKSGYGGYNIGGTRTQEPVATATVINTNGEPVVMLTGDMDGDGKLETVPEDEYVTADQKKEVAEQLQKMPWLRFPQYVAPWLVCPPALLTSLPAWMVTFMASGPSSLRPVCSPSTPMLLRRLPCPLPL